MVSKWAVDFKENVAIVLPVVIGIILCIVGALHSDLALLSIGAGLIGIPGFVKVSGSGGGDRDAEVQS